MKALSASIVIMAAAIMITGGSYIPHDGTRLFVQVVGCAFGLVGLRGWVISLNEK